MAKQPDQFSNTPFLPSEKHFDRRYSQQSAEDQMRRTVKFSDSRLKTSKWSPKVYESIKLISLCHDIYVQHEGERIHYNTSLPDEVALINFAKLYNRELLGEENRMIIIAEGNDQEKMIKKYEKLAFLSFSSERRRMSVVIRDPQTRKI